MGENGGRVVRNMYKGHIDKVKGELGLRVGGGDGWGWGEWWGKNGDNWT